MDFPWIESRLKANTDLCDFWLLLTEKYFAAGDNIRNKSECVPPGIELGIHCHAYQYGKIGHCHYACQTLMR